MAKLNIKELYDKYLWEKCWITLFYKRIYKGMPIDEAIKPVRKSWNGVRSKLYSEELERYYKQPEPKPDKAKFYGRLFKWYSKEEAIKEKLVLKTRKKKKPKLTPAYVRTYTPVINNKDHFDIRITYRKEEAEVIRKAYRNLIEDLERTIVEDEAEAKSLQSRIKELKQEYFIFNNYNNEWM